MLSQTKKYVCWFSCGTASAVATKIFLTQNPNLNIDIINIPIDNEHQDNARFLKDCEKWFGQEIKQFRNEKYKDIYDIFEKIKWINGVNGASCTHNLKGDIYKKYGDKYDFEIIGFTAEEVNRAKRLTHIKGNKFIYPLIDQGLLKSDCLGEIANANIEIPMMYKLGFPNNNCIGCVKGGAGYWNKIRKHFPVQFEKMSIIEQNTKNYNGSIKIQNKRVLLKDLPKNAGRNQEMLPITCSILCSLSFNN